MPLQRSGSDRPRRKALLSIPNCGHVRPGLATRSWHACFRSGVSSVPRRTVKSRQRWTKQSSRLAIRHDGAAQSSSALSARRGQSPRRRSRTIRPGRQSPRGATSVPGHEIGFANCADRSSPRPKPRETMCHARTVTDPGTAAAPRNCVEFARPSLASARLWRYCPIVLGRKGLHPIGRQTSKTRRCRPCTARNWTWQAIRAASTGRADGIRNDPILVTLG